LYLCTNAELDASACVPFFGSEVKLLLFDLASDQSPQARTLIVGIGFCAQEKDLGTRVLADDALRRGDASNAVANDDIPWHRDLVHFLKHVFTYPAFGTDPIVWQILKGRARSYPTVWVAYLGIINIPTCHAFPL
jgi:hypothetical protein